MIKPPFQFIYIYIYIYKVFFNPVNTELGTIPSGQLNYSKFVYLNIPGKEFNVNNFTEQILFQEKNLFSCWICRSPVKKFFIHTTTPPNFYSHHNSTKRGIIIGFYLRALRICSLKYLNDEFNHGKLLA